MSAKLGDTAMGLGGQGFAAAERAKKFVKKQKVFHKKQKKPKNLDDLSYLPSVIQVGFCIQGCIGGLIC